MSLFWRGPEKVTAPLPSVPLYAPTAVDRPPLQAPVPTNSPPAPPLVSTSRSMDQLTSRDVYVRGHKVPIRNAPNEKAPILDRVDNGLVVVECERQGDWVLIEHPTTAKRGWVQAQRISYEPPQETQQEKKRDEEIRKEPKVALTTAAIVAALIRESLTEYHSHAPCACPYDHDRAGRSCGRRSAWSRPGGYSPLCYASDVTPNAIAAYRERVAQQRAN
jgi:hypothetical protein